MEVSMKCKIDNCKNDVLYKKDMVCQKHYFRFMRYGTYDLTRVGAAFRRSNPAGYQVLYIPNHPLAHKGAYVYEHRAVIYKKYGDNLPNCELCGKPCSWAPYTTHIDHIDKDVTNNREENLRVLCNSCNTRRDFNQQVIDSIHGKHMITFNGKTLSAEAWSREPNVNVKGATIIRRISKELSIEDCLFGEKKTHKIKQ